MSPTQLRHLLDELRVEEIRSRSLLHLTANEGLMSTTARAFLDSSFADLYFMGGGDELGIVDFQPFTFRGIESIQQLVGEAERAAMTMLGACSVNLRCLSGVHAMMCALLAATEPGSTVMTVGLENGGHFATPGIVERTGRHHISSSYDLHALRFDAAAIARDIADSGAEALYLDVSFYLNPHNLAEIRAAVGPDLTIIYDASHTLGLIMGGRFQSPFLEGADVICGNTHKTLPGPHKGLIAFREPELAERANQIINNGLYSTSHAPSLIALAITILEVEAHGAAYADQIIANSNALGAALSDLGHEVRRANTGRWSENHQVHWITPHLTDYRSAYVHLRDNGISVNFDRSLGGELYIRLGTQRVTRSGMTERDMAEVAGLLVDAADGRAVSTQVEKLVGSFPSTHFSFDDTAPWAP